MDIPQLKRLAGHVRSLLNQANHAISHNQSLISSPLCRA